jgi:hypothetical protein
MSTNAKPNGQNGVYADSSTDTKPIRPTVASAVRNCGRLTIQQGDASYQTGKSCIGGSAPPDGPIRLDASRPRSRKAARS